MESSDASVELGSLVVVDPAGRYPLRQPFGVHTAGPTLLQKMRVMVATQERLSHESRVSAGSGGVLAGEFLVAVNVRSGDLDQLFLMPPSVKDWLPEDHLAFFVLDVVSELDLAAFYAAYRADGRGGSVYDPVMMLGVLLYAYCTGERSSRRIERRLVEDVGYRVLAVNQSPDHATLARFRRRHQDAIAGLFGQVLGLCVRAGLVDAGVVAIDGTKIAADASFFANRSREELASEILEEAEAIDAAEDALLGDRSGGELPEGWAGGRDRRDRIRAALDELDRQQTRDYESRMAERELVKFFV
jgi:transposase